MVSMVGVVLFGCCCEWAARWFLGPLVVGVSVDGIGCMMSYFYCIPNPLACCNANFNLVNNFSREEYSGNKKV